MKRALIVRFSSLGDVVLTSVLIDPLIAKGYEPYLLTFKPYDSLFEDDYRLRVLGTTKGELFKREFLARLESYKFDLYVDVHKNLRTFMLKLRLGGRWVSYPKDSIRRRLAVRFPYFRKSYSVTESYLRAIGTSAESNRTPKILISEERVSKVRKLLPEKEFIAIAPGARYRKKRYPHYGELAKLIKEEGFEVVWLGNESEGKEIGNAPGLNLCGKLSLTDVLAVISSARAFVGNDSGLLHCARAVGTPAVQIFGGTHPTFGFSLYPEEGKVIIKGLECQPCDLHGKGRCKLGDYRCLEIEPSLILSEILRLVRDK